MVNREDVKIESRNAHDWVVGVLLVSDSEVGCLIPYESEIVVTRVDRLEEGRTGGKQRNVLDVGIVFL